MKIPLQHQIENRSFLKKAIQFVSGILFAGRISLGSPIPVKYYITKCRYDELPGVRFEWLDSRPNPCPGIDWEIVGECSHNTWYDGQSVWNSSRCLFYAVPISGPPIVRIVKLDPIWIKQECDADWDYPDSTTADLSNGKFYTKQ
jgi:hypothetical protein